MVPAGRWTNGWRRRSCHCCCSGWMWGGWPSSRPRLGRSAPSERHGRARHVAVAPHRVLEVVAPMTRRISAGRGGKTPSPGRGAVDELLGVAVECPALEQLKVEVARTPEYRAG